MSRGLSPSGIVFRGYQCIIPGKSAAVEVQNMTSSYFFDEMRMLEMISGQNLHEISELFFFITPTVKTLCGFTHKSKNADFVDIYFI